MLRGLQIYWPVPVVFLLLSKSKQSSGIAMSFGIIPFSFFLSFLLNLERPIKILRFFSLGAFSFSRLARDSTWFSSALRFLLIIFFFLFSFCFFFLNFLYIGLQKYLNVLISRLYFYLFYILFLIFLKY